MALETLAAVALLFMANSPEPADSPLRVDVKVTQKYLVPVCVNGAPVGEGERSWRLLPGNHSLAFTMRNAARKRVPGAEQAPGVAVVQVMLELGHEYEVEVRAPAMTFASRVWTLGEWKPVVRDRTADRIVSSEPDWMVSGCER